MRCFRAYISAPDHGVSQGACLRHTVAERVRGSRPLLIKVSGSFLVFTITHAHSIEPDSPFIGFEQSDCLHASLVRQKCRSREVPYSFQWSLQSSFSQAV